tara:strand:+ start:68 stop:445 length:378 start_codon:yes stop_codon:yes gene_type:complete
MKIKITLILVECNVSSHSAAFNTIRLFLDENECIPSCHLYHPTEQDALKHLVSKHLHTDYEWLNIFVADFRKISTNECEVVYFAKMPQILGADKSGKFYTEAEMMDLKIEDYYEQLISNRGRSYF